VVRWFIWAGFSAGFLQIGVRALFLCVQIAFGCCFVWFWTHWRTALKYEETVSK